VTASNACWTGSLPKREWRPPRRPLPASNLPGGSRRNGRRFLFAINHGREDAAVKADGEELLGGGRFGGTVPGGGVAVIAED
jgi:hypothetical protein